LALNDKIEASMEKKNLSIAFLISQIFKYIPPFQTINHFDFLII